MQAQGRKKSTRRSNEARSTETREALVVAGRALFARDGFAATASPEIVARANVTRGALYHHFDGKDGLFRAVVERELAKVSEEIGAASGEGDAIRQLISGGEAFLAAMADPARMRILLVDAPAVLGRTALAEINARYPGGQLREGIEAALAAKLLPAVPAEALADLLDAMFDRAALAAGEGGRGEDYRRAIEAILEGLRRR
jgi:AcrR family transcriptional regulator